MRSLWHSLSAALPTLWRWLGTRLWRCVAAPGWLQVTARLGSLCLLYRFPSMPAVDAEAREVRVSS